MMLKPYDLLEGVLNEIENGLKHNINENTLADKFSLSSVHLRRLFRFAFRQPIGTYIRSRKLAASIEELLCTGKNIVDIAVEYGIEYEQSYIRAFRREYGITPGELRKSGQIVKIKPPLHLFDSNKLGDNLIFGPDIVMVPQFHVIGKKHKIPARYSNVMPQVLGTHFFFNEMPNIPNAINPTVFINICGLADKGADYWYFMPALQVKTLDNIPEGFDCYTFPTSLCVNFNFIYYDVNPINYNLDAINRVSMYPDDMFKTVDDFMGSEEQKYFLDRRTNINKFYISKENGNYIRLEWLAPVIKKTSLNIAPFNSSGLKNVYQQELPALRFIGKKCIETSETVNALNLLDNWQFNGWFEDIEKQSGIDYKTFYEGADAYINLVRKKDGAVFEHWMGMFTPADTEVPQGYEAIDFTQSKLAVCGVYGKRDEIACYENECRKRLTEEGYTLENTQWYFRRFNWRRFFEIDVYGKRMLEYCYFL